MSVLILKYETMGDEVYESETGPTIGYDNVTTGFHICPEESYDEPWDAEVYRRVDVVAEVHTIGL